jgi:hypothetical protein
MKHKQKQMYEKDVVIKVTCDICDQEGKDGNWPDIEQNTYEARWLVNQTKIFYKTGTSFPEGGMGIQFDVDLCPKCFTELLIPWLRSQGAEVRRSEWDY